MNPNLRKRTAVIAIVVVVAVSLFLGSFFYLNFPRNYAGEMEPLSVAYSPFESVTLFWIAEDQNFFSRNGLNVTSHKYNTGAGALDAVLNGEADFAVGTNEFPLTIRALNQESIRTVGSISKSEFIYLVGRVDRGIENVSDLRGKRVGTTFGTIAHFYLGRFLGINGMNLQDVTLVDLKTPIEWVEAVVNGSIDAVVTAQPYANSAKDGLGANAIVWSMQNSQPLYTQAISSNEWIAEHPDLVNKFIRSLLQAEGFALNYPNEAKAIVKKQMNFTDAYMETVWQQNQFELSLDQSLVAAMEGEARWMISNNLTNAIVVPNFTDYIYLDGLVSIKPESVNVFPLG
jgi:NitT/TauT family transport system substrate-binding protein